MGPASSDEAETALRLAEADPARAAVLAADAVREGLGRRDLRTVSVAERALGVAALHQADVDAATAHLRAAIRYGRRANAVDLVVEARIRLAGVIGVGGRPHRALRELDDVLASDISGHQRARAAAQRGAVLQQLGRNVEALASYQRAIPGLRRAGDQLWLQRALFNRGVLHGYRHEFSSAEADLREAERLCRSLGLELSLGFVQQNLGWVRAIRGDVPSALSYLDESERRLGAMGAGLGEVLTDRSQLLLSASLVSEAREAAEQAVAMFQRDRRQLMLPEVRLLLAEAASRDGLREEAIEQARLAVREFDRQKRARWALLGRYVLVTLREAGGGLPVPLRQITVLADALTDAGWPGAALEMRVLVGRRAQEGRSSAEGCRQLELAARRRHRGPALLRARGWYAEALLRRARGARHGARTAVRAGLRVLDDHRGALGATDLRAHASAHRIDLAELGLAMAFEDGRPGTVLRWAEERRASHLLLNPVRPPQDPTLAQALGELRVTVSEIDAARGVGHVPAGLVQRQLELERDIRDHCRRVEGRSDRPSRSFVALDGLAAVLDDTVLVEFIAMQGTLHAASVVDGRTRLHRLGEVASLTALTDRVPFALNRLARRTASQASHAAALALLTDTAQRLDAFLLGPLGGVIGDRELVVIPTGPLLSLPWSILPSCAQRAVTVAPSAALWLDARRRQSASDGHTSVAAGPGLPGARAEAEVVGALHGAAPLTGAAATVEAVTRSIRGARLAHLAAHGQLHAHNPLFSSIRLADGPLTVYDLEGLGQGPLTVVLSACNSGRAVVCAGDELLGLSAAFLSLGTQQVVASVIPVPDAETAPLMTAFHECLLAGRSVADALARAQAGMSHTDPAVVAAATGFVCIGADGTAAGQD